MHRLFGITVLIACSVVPAFSQSAPQRRHAPLVVGWHDEMNDPGPWRPIGLENQPDVYAARPGVVTLRLPHVPDGFPYQFQWSGVTRSISADLGHFPVLIARVDSLEEGTYAHLEVEERDFSGRPVRTLRSPTLVRPGLTILDLGKEIGPSVRRLTLRLIVGGKLAGAQCDYNWIRFIRSEDVAWLREAPDIQTVISREPSGDVRVPPYTDESIRPATTQKLVRPARSPLIYDPAPVERQPKR